MSGYLLQQRINFLQSEIDLLKAVDGLTNPLAEDLDANGKNITNAAIIISDEYIQCRNLVLPNQEGGLNLSIQASVIDTKSMLTLCTEGGSNYAAIYDTYYNQPPTASLANILATSSNAGAGAITNLINLTTTGSVSTPYLNLPLTTANPNLLSDFLILKANNNPAFGPSAVSFAYKAGTNPDPTGLSYSCFNDNTVNPSLGTVSVTKNTVVSGDYSQFPYNNITGTSYYWFPIWSWTIPEGISFNNVIATIPSITLSTAGGIGTILPFPRTFYLHASLTNSLSALANDFELGTSQFASIVYPSNVTSYTRVLTNQYLVSQYNKPQRGNKVYLALFWDDGYPLPNPVVPITFSWSEIELASVEFTLSNSRLTSDPEATDGGGGITP